MRDLCDREFDILCLAADSKGYLRIEDFAETILPSCPGPRTAATYAREYVYRLCSWGLMENHNRRSMLYRATDAGRRYLASTAH